MARPTGINGDQRGSICREGRKEYVGRGGGGRGKREKRKRGEKGKRKKEKEGGGGGKEQNIKTGGGGGIDLVCVRQEHRKALWLKEVHFSTTGAVEHKRHDGA